MATDREIDQFIENELKELQAALSEQHDLVIEIVRYHLLAENSLERIILGSLPRGDRLIDKGGLTFAQKLTVVEALDVLKDSAIQAMRNLNAVRNECVHQKGKAISEADIDRIGRPFGSIHTKARNEYRGDLVRLARSTFHTIHGRLLATVARLELGEYVPEQTS